jgi:hypothetical protein
MQVAFRSDPEFYRKEHNGYKPNTVREVDETDHRFITLRAGRAKTIRIVSTKTNQSFMRVITDVSFYKNLCIISWRHA